MNVFYVTFGCKVNQYETENIRQAFSARGYGEADAPAQAEVCVINTCTVTAESDKKCVQYLRRVRRESPSCVTVMTGCFPQAHRERAESLAECDIVTGAADKTVIPALVDEFIRTRQRIAAVTPHAPGERFEPMENAPARIKTRGYIKIEDGCDRYCAYCIIPFARGAVRSKPLDALTREAAGLVAAGVREIVLTGINLNRYGADFGLADGLCAAAEAVCATGVERVRLGSLEPELMTDAVIARLAALKPLCPQFHLSLQSGCDNILRAMNRHYDTALYRTVCEKLRAAFPDCAITTDVMVGFPGETNEDFAQSLAFVRTTGFARAHVFPFSAREGTAAFSMPAQIPAWEKARRAEAMRIQAAESEAASLEKMVGKTVHVLFEKENCTDFHHGYSENYTLVKIARKNAQKSLRASVFCVRIIGNEDDFCIGEIV
ncbi:MAG: tRNA (N(6)-L-threonylcarbamoyladenosine(37)-C(2))-methylthiotransferase MtaB [Oscillospiraceae bacterium]